MLILKNQYVNLTDGKRIKLPYDLFVTCDNEVYGKMDDGSVIRVSAGSKSCPNKLPYLPYHTNKFRYDSGIIMLDNNTKIVVDDIMFRYFDPSIKQNILTYMCDNIKNILSYFFTKKINKIEQKIEGYDQYAEQYRSFDTIESSNYIEIPYFCKLTYIKDVIDCDHKLIKDTYPNKIAYNTLSIKYLYNKIKNIFCKKKINKIESAVYSQYIPSQCRHMKNIHLQIHKNPSNVDAQIVKKPFVKCICVPKKNTVHINKYNYKLINKLFKQKPITNIEHINDHIFKITVLE